MNLHGSWLWLSLCDTQSSAREHCSSHRCIRIPCGSVSLLACSKSLSEVNFLKQLSAGGSEPGYTQRVELPLHDTGFVCFYSQAEAHLAGSLTTCSLSAFLLCPQTLPVLVGYLLENTLLSTQLSSLPDQAQGSPAAYFCVPSK